MFEIQPSFTEFYLFQKENKNIIKFTKEKKWSS